MTDNEKKVLFGFGLLGVGVFLFMKRGSLSSLASSALDEVNASIFTAILPSRAQPYSAVIRQVGQEQSMDPFLLVALVQREDPAWDPNIVSFDGGHGLTQITSDKAWIASGDPFDPYRNLTRGAQMLNDEIARAHRAGLEGDLAIQAALGSYNHGPVAITNVVNGLSPDTGTTGNNYATSVWNTFQTLSTSFANSIGDSSFAGWQDAGAGRRGPGGSGFPQV